MALTIPASPEKPPKPTSLQYAPEKHLEAAHLTKTAQAHAQETSSSPLPSPALFQKAEATKEGTRADVKTITDTQLAARFQFIEEVGYGNWGSVWRCKPQDPQETVEEFVAVKLVHRTKSSTTAPRIKSLWTEFKVLKQFDSHPNLVQFSDFILTPSYAIIVMDYHPHLLPVELSEKRALPYFKQLLSALGFLHEKGVTHNDIKPSNILLSRHDQVALCDFGFAQQYSVDLQPEEMDKSGYPAFHSKMSWGTCEYLSPERAKNTLHDERLSDIWSLGVTFYEIVVGRTPFEADSSEEFLTKEAIEVYYLRTLTGQFYGEQSLTKDFQNLIHLMVEPDFVARLRSCEATLKHAFFQQLKPPAPRRQSMYTPRDMTRNRTLSALLGNDITTRSQNVDSSKSIHGTSLSEFIKPSFSYDSTKRQLSELCTAATSIPIASPAVKKRMPIKIYQDGQFEADSKATSNKQPTAHVKSKRAFPASNLDSPRQIATSSPAGKYKAQGRPSNREVLNPFQQSSDQTNRLRTQSLKVDLKRENITTSRESAENNRQSVDLLSAAAIRSAEGPTKRPSKLIKRRPSVSNKLSSASLNATKIAFDRAEADRIFSASQYNLLDQCKAIQQAQGDVNERRIVQAPRQNVGCRTQIPVRVSGPVLYRPPSRNALIAVPRAIAMEQANTKKAYVLEGESIGEDDNAYGVCEQPRLRRSQALSFVENASGSVYSSNSDGNGNDQDLNPDTLHASDFSTTCPSLNSGSQNQAANMIFGSSQYNSYYNTTDKSNIAARDSGLNEQDTIYDVISHKENAKEETKELLAHSEFDDSFDSRPSFQFSIRSGFSFRSVFSRTSSTIERNGQSLNQQESSAGRISKIWRKLKRE